MCIYLVVRSKIIQNVFLLKKRLIQKNPIKIINYNQEKFPVVLFQTNLFIGNKNQKYQNKKISIHYSYFFGFE